MLSCAGNPFDVYCTLRVSARIGPLRAYSHVSTSRHPFITFSPLTCIGASSSSPFSVHQNRHGVTTSALSATEDAHSQDPQTRAVNSMGKLRDFLSSQPNPRPMTVREIRHRYQFWKTHHVLHKMTSLELSSLIRLLGTLSISEYGHPQTSLYTHPRASQMPESTFVPHWTFLKQVGKDKRWLRHPLLPSDHYWLLRAYLALFWEQVQTGENLNRSPVFSAEPVMQILRRRSRC